MRMCRATLAVLLLTAGTTACEGDRIADFLPAQTELRLVNATIDRTVNSPPGAAIRVTVDGLATSPGAQDLPLAQVRAHEPLRAGVHAFGAFGAGDQQLFTTPAGVAAEPRMYLSGAVKYTLIPTGVVPPDGALNGVVQPIIVFDETFEPVRYDGSYGVRFKVVNAAPYAAGPSGTGATVQMFLTPGSEPLTSTTGLSPLGTVSYRNASAYLNTPGGAYVLTLVAGGRILASQPVTLSAGEVRTFIIVNTDVVTDVAQIGPSTHRILNLLDATH